MKLKALLLLLVLVTLSGTAWGRSDPRKNRRERVQKKEQSVPAQSGVTVVLCMLSGSVNVRGWDKNEVLARAAESAQIGLRRSDKGDEAKPASRVDVLIVDNEGRRTRAACQSSTDVELNVPRGATVQIQSRDGDIDIAEVATAYVGSQDGKITLQRIGRVAEVGSVGGDISVQDSAGRIDLTSIGGVVTVTNVKPIDPGDTFEVITVSGDVELSQIGHALLNVRTVNGNMRLVGPLRPDGRYGVSTMSGDVTFALPADASFRLNAKVSSGGDIITDFPLRLISQAVSTSKPKSAPTKIVVPKIKGAPPQAAPKEQHPATPPGKRPPQTIPDRPSSPDPKIAPAPRTPIAPMVVTPAPKVTAVVRVNPEGMIDLYTFRRVNAVCGTGDALITVASFSGTLHLQKN